MAHLKFQLDQRLGNAIGCTETRDLIARHLPPYRTNVLEDELGDRRGEIIWRDNLAPLQQAENGVDEGIAIEGRELVGGECRWGVDEVGFAAIRAGDEGEEWEEGRESGCLQSNVEFLDDVKLKVSPCSYIG